MSQNSILLLIQSFDTAAIQAWASKSKLQVYAFPAGDKWTALALKDGLVNAQKRAQSLSLALKTIVIDFKFFLDYYLELNVYDLGHKMVYYYREMGEASQKADSYEQLKPYAINPGQIDLIQAGMAHHELLLILKKAFAWRDIEQFEYDFFAQADQETLERCEAQQLSGKKPIQVSKIIICECGEELQRRGYVQDTVKSELHGKYHNLYFRKSIGGFRYYISFHFDNESLAVGYSYPSDQPPEQYFKKRDAGLNEKFLFKSEKALKGQLKLVLENILVKGIPFLESQIHESFDMNEALEQSADLHYRRKGFSIRRGNLKEWMSLGAEFIYEKNQYKILYRLEANRTFLNVYLSDQKEEKFMICVLQEMMEEELLPFAFHDYRDLELEAYYLDFRNKVQFMSRLESTYRFAELALDYLDMKPRSNLI
ncbi:hypothetical protein [Cohnella hashimotonis]|uniref:Uncharacterized protein n=1 Tax=Cohnella hashimotonis TaxID=2826895 RepID=A0ABT6TQJ7_9BACL|nr:hypothetical protein [Cohnella hashimotonis]MDI4648204.1 hypothetical protein [Cohnella hashimotonis]